MKLERFFEKFEQFADAPNAVAKMRELVLELACHGKLLEQSSEDESASKLLARIENHLELLRSRRELRGSPVEPLNLSELPAIPSNWEWVPLGNVVGYGSSDKAESADISDDAWLLDLEDIEKDSSRLLQRKTFGESPSKSTKTAFRAGDVLYGKLRPYLNKVLVADAPGYCTTEIIPICTFGFIEPAYLCYALKRPEFLAYANSKSYGMNLPRLGTDDARRAAFPLPPLAEQKRIVTKVDELMALCDRLEAQQQERDTSHAALARASLARFVEAPTPANLDFLFLQSYAIPPADLRKSILTLAVQGKLVPQDANDEPADMLLDRIASKRTTQLKAAYPNRGESTTQLRKQESQALPSNLEPLAPGWAWATLIQASLLVVDCHNKTAPYVAKGIRLLRTTNIRNGQMNLVEPKFVAEVTYERWSARCKPESGDILITREAPMGEVCIIPEGMKICLGQRMMLIRVVPGTMDTKYLLYSLMAPDLMDRVQDKPVGATVQHLRVGGVETLLTPVPPLAEQRRIVAKVDQLMALVDQLESQLAEAKSRSAALLEAVVHELLNPSAEVIDLASYRAAIGCYTISKMSQQPYFGRTAAMKMLYLAQAHVGLNLCFQPEREAAGPLDHWLYRFEDEGKQKAWFKAVENTSNGKMKVKYQPGKMLAAQAALAESQLAQEQRKEFDRLLDLLSDKKTEEVEIIATLFAVWNDFLLDGHAPSDDEIVTEVRENWHVKKERFTPTLLRQWLGWLRRNNLVPQGRSPHTIYQSQLLN